MRNKETQVDRHADGVRLWHAAAAAIAACGYLGAWLWLRAEALGTVTYMTMPEAGDIRRYSLPDGSAVTLNADTIVRVWMTAWSRKVELLRGEGLFGVEHHSRRPFVVLARDNRVQSSGGRFAVRAVSDTSVSVLVVEGEVLADQSEQHLDPVGAPLE